MPVYPRNLRAPQPASLTFAGHSFLNTTTGILDQRYRIDAMVRAHYNVQAINVQNHAISGALLVREWAAGVPVSYGAFPVILQQINRPTLGSAPYVAGTNGPYVLGWGINDLGNVPTTGGSAGMTQVIAAFKHAMRAMISRCRAAATYEGAWTGSGGQLLISYGSNWTSAGSTQAFSSGTDIRGCSNTSTNNVITITLPTDYAGEDVAIGFIGQTSGATWGSSQTAGFGGTATFGGTALTTGVAGGASSANGATFSTSNVMPLGTTHTPLCFRITDLDTTAAGKTITITCTAVDSGASATLYFDYVQLEALDAPAVVVMNCARSIASGTSLGYGSYNSIWSGGNSYWKGQGTPGSTGDTDVAALNTELAALVAEFDGRVQLADVDTAIGGSATYLNSGDLIHPNSRGARLAADAICVAMDRARSLDSSVTETPFQGGGAVRIPHVKSTYWGAQQWYCQSVVQASSSNYTFVAGDMFAVPFMITEAAEFFDALGMEVTTASTTTSPTVRLAIYQDENLDGYPRVIYSEPLGAVFSPGTTTGFKTTSTFTLALDAGLYWLSMKVETVGTASATQVRGMASGRSDWLPVSSTALSGTPDGIGIKLTGQSTGAMPATFPTSGTLITSTAVPRIFFRRV